MGELEEANRMQELEGLFLYSAIGLRLTGRAGLRCMECSRKLYHLWGHYSQYSTSTKTWLTPGGQATLSWMCRSRQMPCLMFQRMMTVMSGSGQKEQVEAEEQGVHHVAELHPQAGQVLLLSLSSCWALVDPGHPFKLCLSGTWQLLHQPMGSFTPMERQTQPWATPGSTGN